MARCDRTLQRNIAMSASGGIADVTRTASEVRSLMWWTAPAPDNEVR